MSSKYSDHTDRTDLSRVVLERALAERILSALNLCSVRARSPAELNRTRDLAIQLHGFLHPLNVGGGDA